MHVITGPILNKRIIHDDILGGMPTAALKR
jgi:hypothetical protein